MQTEATILRKENKKEFQPNIVSVARRAFGFLKSGFISGDFEPYFAMLTDDYVFYLPLEPARGKHRGIEEARKYYQMSKDSHSWLDLREPTVTSNEKTVVFEFTVKGHIAGADFHNRIAIALDVRGEQISGFREYIGDVDPQFVAKLLPR